MQRLQAYRFELRPDGGQRREMRRTAGACRFVYNRALVLVEHTYEETGKHLGYAATCKMLTRWRHDDATPWLKDSPSGPQQQALKNLQSAYQRYFKQVMETGRGDKPAFKRKFSSRISFRYPNPGHIELDEPNSRIFLPKLGWIRYRNSQPIKGDLRSVTVSERGGKWSVSVLTRREVEEAQHPATSMVGVDFGITRFATLSDGLVVLPINAFKSKKAKLARAQRRLKLKVKFSSNWKKQQRRIARIHIQVADARRDHQQKASTEISKNHAIIVIEDLKVKNMSRSAAGTVENPGTNVRQKSGFNRAILDQGWGEFRRQLEYKQEWAGGQVLAVPAHNTSRTCPVCKCVSALNRVTQSEFACVECGYQDNADTVGALNILERGHRLLACGEMAAGSLDEAGTHRGDQSNG